MLEPLFVFRALKINIFFEIVKKDFILFNSFWRALYGIFLCYSHEGLDDMQNGLYIKPGVSLIYLLLIIIYLLIY